MKLRLSCKFKHLRQNRCNQYLKRAAIIAALFIFTCADITIRSEYQIDHQKGFLNKSIAIPVKRHIE